MSESYKSFTLNEAGDPEPWSTAENSLFKDIIQTLVMGCCTETKDTDGHRHYRLHSQDGSTAKVTVNSDGNTEITSRAIVQGGQGEAAHLELHADEGDDDADKYRISGYDSDTGTCRWETYATGSWVAGIEMKSDADIVSNGIGTNTTTGTSPNLYMDGNYEIFRDTSSERYKGNIKNLEGSERLFALTPRQYNPAVRERKTVMRTTPRGKKIAERVLGKVMRYEDRKCHGFIAEEVERVYPELVARDTEGRPDWVQYVPMIADIIDQLQKMNTRLKALEQ